MPREEVAGGAAAGAGAGGINISGMGAAVGAGKVKRDMVRFLMYFYLLCLSDY